MRYDATANHVNKISKMYELVNHHFHHLFSPSEIWLMTSLFNLGIIWENKKRSIEKGHDMSHEAAMLLILSCKNLGRTKHSKLDENKDSKFELRSFPSLERVMQEKREHVGRSRSGGWKPILWCFVVRICIHWWVFCASGRRLALSWCLTSLWPATQRAI